MPWIVRVKIAFEEVVDRADLFERIELHRTRSCRW